MANIESGGAFVRKKGVCCLLIAGTLWGFMGFFVRNMMALGFDQLQVIFMKMLLGIVFLAAFLLAKDPSLFRIRRWRDLWFLAASGLISLLGFNFFYYKAMEVTTLALAGVLLYVAPGIAMLLSAVIFKERITPRKIIALFILFGGCAAAGGVLEGEWSITLSGFLLCMGAAFCYGLYSIFGRIAVERGYHAYTTTLYNMIFCFLGTLPLVDFSGLVAVMSPPLFAYSCGIAIPCAAIAYVFYTSGLKYVEAGEASMLATVEAVVAVLVSVFLFDEAMTVGILAGILLIIGGIALMSGGPSR